MCYIIKQQHGATKKPKERKKKMKVELIALAIIAILAFAVNANGVEVSENILNAIFQVESSGGKFLKGDYSKKTGEYRAIGPFQLWRIYVDDVNSILKNKGISKRYTYADRWSYQKSREMVIIYLKHYGRQFEIDSERYITSFNPSLKGKIKVSCNDMQLAMIHNGGPSGWKKAKHLEYWNKVKKELK
jgi:hypothetical protein